jgi:hypothetical protein
LHRIRHIVDLKLIGVDPVCWLHTHHTTRLNYYATLESRGGADRQNHVRIV